MVAEKVTAAVALATNGQAWAATASRSLATTGDTCANFPILISNYVV